MQKHIEEVILNSDYVSSIRCLQDTEQVFGKKTQTFVDRVMRHRVMTFLGGTVRYTSASRLWRHSGSKPAQIPAAPARPSQVSSPLPGLARLQAPAATLGERCCHRCGCRADPGRPHAPHTCAVPPSGCPSASGRYHTSSSRRGSRAWEGWAPAALARKDGRHGRSWGTPGRSSKPLLPTSNCRHCPQEPRRTDGIHGAAGGARRARPVLPRPQSPAPRGARHNRSQWNWHSWSFLNSSPAI